MGFHSVFEVKFRFSHRVDEFWLKVPTVPTGAAQVLSILARDHWIPSLFIRSIERASCQYGIYMYRVNAHFSHFSRSGRSSHKTILCNVYQVLDSISRLLRSYDQPLGICATMSVTIPPRVRS